MTLSVSPNGTIWRVSGRMRLRGQMDGQNDVRAGTRCHREAGLRNRGAAPAGARIVGVEAAAAISHAVTELEFHISPVASPSRPQTGVGTSR